MEHAMVVVSPLRRSVIVKLLQTCSGGGGGGGGGLGLKVGTGVPICLQTLTHPYTKKTQKVTHLYNNFVGLHLSF